MHARRRFRRYPSQVVVPSQAPARNPAFIPLVQADMLQKRGLQHAFKSGYVRPEPYVISQYDARPINCIDFVNTFTAAEQAGADVRTFTYNVPAGRVAVLRRLDVRFYVTGATGRDAITAAPLAATSLSVSVDGIPLDQLNNIRIDDAVCGFFPIAGVTTSWQNGLSFPLYAIAPPRSAVAVRVALVGASIATFDFAFVAPVLYGNLLLEQGINPTSEPGTLWAVPTFPSSRAVRDLTEHVASTE